ncbi:MAG: IS110 family transposase [Treponema sp.]
MKIITQNEKNLYVGIDVHKDTYSLCCFDFQRNELSDEITIRATTKGVIKYLEAIRKKHREEVLFACGYEAGPTGYGLCRGLQKAGYGCVVMAPTTMSNPDGKRRIKTDRIDARAISRILAYKSYSQVHLPSEEIEALKEYTRARYAKKRMLKKAKQELLSFLLRNGKTYPESGNYWTEKFFNRIKTVQFSKKWMQEAFNEYLAEVYSLKAKIERMDMKIREIAGLEIIKDKVDKLVCFSGIDVSTAVETVVEINDFTRFATAAQFVSYLGLCPRQDSGGKRKTMLPLTKAGNCRVRTLLCESAKAIKRTNPYGQKSGRILERQKNASPEIVAYADKATKRIRTKMKNLEECGKNYNVSSAAGARELACFVWGMMNGKIA